mmetsp:Transcript_11715/g.11632  ORF Transcript_11715/g.11632 Transcript_11715/m.11632 type:complete len:144 (+) Transcript_11715:959-1390(+)
MTEELERKNERMQKQKLLEREKAGEVEIWKQEIRKEDDALKELRLQVDRRKELIYKKEISVLDWSKRNFREGTDLEKEKKLLSEKQERLLQEEGRMNEEFKQLKRKEQEELARKAKVNESRKEQLERIRKEEKMGEREALDIE